LKPRPSMAAPCHVKERTSRRRQYRVLEGNEGHRDGRQEVGASRSTREVGEPTPWDPTEGRGSRATEPLEGKTKGTSCPERVIETATDSDTGEERLERPRPQGTRRCRRAANLLARRAGCGKSARPDPREPRGEIPGATRLVITTVHRGVGYDREPAIVGTAPEREVGVRAEAEACTSVPELTSATRTTPVGRTSTHTSKPIGPQSAHPHAPPRPPKNDRALLSNFELSCSFPRCETLFKQPRMGRRGELTYAPPFVTNGGTGTWLKRASRSEPVPGVRASDKAV